MSPRQAENLKEIWHEVRQWPSEMRLSLAAQILRSLEQEQAAPPQQTPTDLIGSWKTDQPPDDEEIERILDEERLRKHG